MDDDHGDLQAAQGRFTALLPYVRELDQLLRDHPGLLMMPLEEDHGSFGFHRPGNKGSSCALIEYVLP
jgi:hypothetical protein